MSILNLAISTFVFWFLYATLMRIMDKRAKYGSNSWQYWTLTVIGTPFAVVGVPYDVAYNYTWGSLVFWQFPRKGEWTFTARLQRSVRLIGKRGGLARFICRYLVEPWDADHCGAGRYP